MSVKIKNPPANEMELVELTEFIEKSRNETKQAQEDHLREVEAHHNIMDEFSFMYQEEDIVNALSMKCWPSQIQTFWHLDSSSTSSLMALSLVSQLFVSGFSLPLM